MKTKHLFLIGLVVAFSSCSTAYRTGQTPDDVYYSPAPAPQESYVVANNQDDRDSYVYRNQEEREIRRGIRDSRYRNDVSFNIGYGYSPFGYNSIGYSPFGYSSIGYSPFGYNPYSYNPYAFGYKGIYDPYSFNPFYNPYNPYSHYGNYGNYYSGHYGSYYPPVVIVPGGRVNTNTGPRRVNLGAYNNTSGSNSGVRPNNSGVRSGNATAPRTTTAPVRSFKRSNETGVGNVMRRVFTPSQSNSNSNNQRSEPRRNNNSNMDTRSSQPPTRTFSNPSPAPSTSQPSSTAPVRTFRNN